MNEKSKWIYEHSYLTEGEYSLFKCSECGKEVEVQETRKCDFKFCPYCGNKKDLRYSR